MKCYVSNQKSLCSNGLEVGAEGLSIRILIETWRNFLGETRPPKTRLKTLFKIDKKACHLLIKQEVGCCGLPVP